MLRKWKGISDNAEHVYRQCSEDALRLLSPTAILRGRYYCYLHFTEREIETEKECIPESQSWYVSRGHQSLKIWLFSLPPRKRGAGELDKEHVPPVFICYFQVGHAFQGNLVGVFQGSCRVSGYSSVNYMLQPGQAKDSAYSLAQPFLFTAPVWVTLDSG